LTVQVLRRSDVFRGRWVEDAAVGYLERATKARARWEVQASVQQQQQQVAAAAAAAAAAILAQQQRQLVGLM
jgi:hypothetical protein